MLNKVIDTKKKKGEAETIISSQMFSKLLDDITWETDDNGEPGLKKEQMLYKIEQRSARLDNKGNGERQRQTRREKRHHESGTANLPVILRELRTTTTFAFLFIWPIEKGSNGARNVSSASEHKSLGHSNINFGACLFLEPKLLF